MLSVARRTSLLVAFCLLTATATAYAECAWMLWSETPPGSGTWALANSIRVAFEKKGDCEREARNEHQARALSADEAATRGAQVPAVFLVCLPDTVDPRAPKAK